MTPGESVQVAAGRAATPPTADDAKPELPGAGSLHRAEPCWRRTGSWGDGSCPDLRRQTHCRHCPVFAQAAAQVLDRPLPADYRRQWTTRVAAPRPVGTPADTAAVLFRIGGEWLALDAKLVLEVTGHRPMHSLPHLRRDVVVGLANVRGELVPCLALGRLMGLEQDLPVERLCAEHRYLLVLEGGGGRLAFPADEVQGVCRFSRRDLRPPPETVARARRVFTRGIFEWRDRAVGYLDGDAVWFHLERSLA